MIIGEGSVFLVLMVVGAAYTLRSFKKEVQLAKRQQNFLLSVTHELKTPIASIRLYLQTLQKRQLDELKQQNAIETMLRENDRLDSLVGKLLLTAKMDNEAFDLELESLDLKLALKEIVERYSTFVVLKVEEDLTVDLDKEAVISIATNLIENAKKYGASEVKITGSKATSGIELQFVDNGQGIPNSEKEKIFQRFYRVGNEEVRKTEGTGLGLYIVKTLVEKMGGVIKVIDNSPKGSIFVIQFRIA